MQQVDLGVLQKMWLQLGDRRVKYYNKTNKKSYLSQYMLIVHELLVNFLKC